MWPQQTQDFTLVFFDVDVVVAVVARNDRMSFKKMYALLFSAVIIAHLAIVVEFVKGENLKCDMLP